MPLLPDDLTLAELVALNVFNTRAIEGYLLVTLDAGTPLSLRQVARDIGTTVGATRYHFPSLVNRLFLIWKAHLAAELNRRKVPAREATFNGIETWRRRHTEPLSRKRLLADLMKETGLPKEVLRKAIQQWWLPALTARAQSRFLWNRPDQVVARVSVAGA